MKTKATLPGCLRSSMSIALPIDLLQFTVELVLFRDSLLPRPENGTGTQAGKERVLYYLQAHARNDAIFSPKTGEKPYLGKYSLFGHSLFRVLLHWIHGDKI